MSSILKLAPVVVRPLARGVRQATTSANALAKKIAEEYQKHPKTPLYVHGTNSFTPQDLDEMLRNKCFQTVVNLSIVDIPQEYTVEEIAKALNVPQSYALGFASSRNVQYDTMKRRGPPVFLVVSSPNPPEKGNEQADFFPPGTLLKVNLIDTAKASDMEMLRHNPSMLIVNEKVLMAVMCIAINTVLTVAGKFFS